MDEISDHAKVLTLSDDLERTVEERVNILFDFVKVKTFCWSVSQLLPSLELLLDIYYLKLFVQKNFWGWFQALFLAGVYYLEVVESSVR